MPKVQRVQNFEIHVDDPLYPTNSCDTKIQTKRNDSDQTIIHSSVKDVEAIEEESRTDNDSQLSSNISLDPHSEALIHAAACAVVASMEQEGYRAEDLGFESGDEDHGERTELTYGTDHAFDYAEATYESDDMDDPYDGSASSHLGDDIFSDHGHSHRSSLNSSDEQQTDEDAYIRNVKRENELAIGGRESEEVPSRMPSVCSNAYSLLPEPLTLTSSHPRNPKVVARTPFRSPSSVRALQMSSPAPSIFSSPRSSKRTTVSRLDTPHNRSSSKTKTPGRFKFKKDDPLVLLHVTVLPLRWLYADTIDGFTGDGISRDLVSVKESWKLLQEKLGDTVLERGVLLPHPQDSYELLEERLLQALELPVKPRARILTCGHYVGPDEMSSEEDSETDEEGKSVKDRDRERWCDICGREVLYEECRLGARDRRFKVKVYASNGLMRAGAWAAAWREMERVDIELEPLVEMAVGREIDQLLSRPPPTPQPEFEPEIVEELLTAEELPTKVEEDDEVRRRLSEERLREIYGSNHNVPPSPRTQSRARRQKHGDSLAELLFAALKVVMRDRKNVAIAVLSLVVLLLAFRPANNEKAGAELNEVLGGSAVLLTEAVGESSAPIRRIMEGAEIESHPPSVVEEMPMPTIVQEVQGTIKETPETKTLLEPAVNQEMHDLSCAEEEIDATPAAVEVDRDEQAAQGRDDVKS